MKINDSDICDALFESIPSDDESFTSVDDTDEDIDYTSKIKNANFVIEESTDSSDCEVGSDVEILNLDNNITHILPSPVKTRSSIRKTRNNVVDYNQNKPRSRRNVFPNTISQNTMLNQEVLLAQPLSEELNVSIENVNVFENGSVASDEFNFVEPVWSTSTNFTLSTPPFTHLEGPTDETDILIECTPFSIFKLLVTNEVIEHITYHTNLYSQQIYQQKGKMYEPTTFDEISLFIGINNILMGIKKMCSYRDYWSSAPDLNDAYISNLMPFNRFSWILSHIHVNDNSTMPKKGEENFDKLFKIRPFLDFILKNSQRLYNPTKIIAIDESMIKFKGRHSAKQYLPKKPIKRGYKVWALADKNGYLWNFDLYIGKSGDLAEKNLGARVIKQLCQPLQNKNHHLYFDNYFTSYPLMTFLKSKNIHACVTVNMTRKFLPTLKLDKELKTGEYDWRIDQYSTSIVKWKDKRCVSLLSNFHDPKYVETVQRKAKDGNISYVPCPSVLKDYNQNMNCVDRFDQNKKTCQIDRKSKKWWHRIFFHFIDVAIVNAHVIYTQKTGTKIRMKDFRRQISSELVRKKMLEKRRTKQTSESPPVQLKKNKPSVPENIRLDQSAHQPIRSSRRRCGNCSTKAKEIRTEWICSVCNIPLCLNKNKNCFSEYHNN